MVSHFRRILTTVVGLALCAPALRAQEPTTLTGRVLDASSMDAEVVRDDDGTLVVSARWLDAVTGHGYPGEGWTFELPRSDVARVDVRRLSVWRTAPVGASFSRAARRRRADACGAPDPLRGRRPPASVVATRRHAWSPMSAMSPPVDPA